jgi:hypothetical protein
MQGRIAKTDTFNKPKGVNMEITLRDYFAANAMVGLMGMERAELYIGEDGIEMDYDKEGDIGTLFVHTDFLTEEAYMIADMMLKARGE